MDFERIDLNGIEPGFGSMWQGGSVDQAIDSLPGPLLIVAMNEGEVDESWINHQNVQAVLAVWIEDSPSAVLPDMVLLMVVDSCGAWLKDGGNIYDHCAAGISRSGYLDVAIHMRLLNLSYDDALAYVRRERPGTSPNSGFENQLRTLEAKLRSSSR